MSFGAALKAKMQEERKVRRELAGCPLPAPAPAAAAPAPGGLEHRVRVLADVDHARRILHLHNLDHGQAVAEAQHVFHGEQRPWQDDPLRLSFDGRILGNVPRIHDLNAEQRPRPLLPFRTCDVVTNADSSA